MNDEDGVVELAEVIDRVMADLIAKLERQGMAPDPKKLLDLSHLVEDAQYGMDHDENNHPEPPPGYRQD